MNRFSFICLLLSINRQQHYTYNVVLEIFFLLEFSLKSSDAERLFMLGSGRSKKKIMKGRKQVIKMILLKSIKHVVELHSISSSVLRGCSQIHPMMFQGLPFFLQLTLRTLPTFSRVCLTGLQGLCNCYRISFIQQHI